jgi:ABC-type transporter Mla MlaB component
MLESDDVDVVTCDLSDLGRCDAYDLAAIDELARLQLTAHRLGKRILIRADSELAGLFDLTGLNEFLPCDPD